MASFTTQKQAAAGVQQRSAAAPRVTASSALRASVTAAAEAPCLRYCLGHAVAQRSV